MKYNLHVHLPIWESQIQFLIHKTIFFYSEVKFSNENSKFHITIIIVSFTLQ